MPRWLKRGMDASAIKAADAKVRETVENILADIDADITPVEASLEWTIDKSRRRGGEREERNRRSEQGGVRSMDLQPVALQT